MAKLKEIGVNYSASMKASLPHNRYESASVHVSRSETWEVESEEEGNKLYKERFAALQTELGDFVVEKYNEIKGGEL